MGSVTHPLMPQGRGARHQLPPPRQRWPLQAAPALALLMSLRLGFSQAGARALLLKSWERARWAPRSVSKGARVKLMPNEKCAAVAPDPDSPTRTVPVPRKEPEGVDCGADSEGVPAGVTRPRRRPAAALATVGGGGTWADFAAGVFAGSIPRASVAFVATAAGVKLYMIGRV